MTLSRKIIVVNDFTDNHIFYFIMMNYSARIPFLARLNLAGAKN